MRHGSDAADTRRAILQAILLCGGLGTRLRPVVSDRPKPLADIHGKAFMEYVTDELRAQGITELIFAAGYKGRMVEDYFGDGSRFGITARYAYEKEPLGTGGALRNALPLVHEEEVFVLNADTFYRIDYLALKRLLDAGKFSMALYTREVPDISRYGEVKRRGNRLLSWNEKSEEHRSGEINGGIYLIRRALLERIPEGKRSLENEEIPAWLAAGIGIGVKRSEGYFIDIGIPESYRQFCADAEKGCFHGL